MDPARQHEHLRLLAILHHVHAALAFLCSSAFFLHVYAGYRLVHQPDVLDQWPAFALWLMRHDTPPELVGISLMFLGGSIVLLGWMIAFSLYVAARAIARRTDFWMIIGVAGLECLLPPFGTVLGMFTILIIARPEVRALFRISGRAGSASAAPAAPSAGPSPPPPPAPMVPA